MTDEFDENDVGEELHFQKFIPLMKVDVAKREVWGLATIEEEDLAGETLDYDTSKPYFKVWSEKTQKRSMGKSKGNLRSMHGPTAAGKLIYMDFDDAKKAIPIGAKVTNDDEWTQVMEGVYTGFSVGGRYVKRWYENGKMRYTADPMEISLVDAPCVESATFQMVKADGVEVRHFKKVGPQEPMSVPASEVDINRDTPTFNTLVVSPDAIPGTGALVSAGVPGQKVMPGYDVASPNTDASPDRGKPNEAAYKAAEGDKMADPKEDVQKVDATSAARQLLSTVRGNISSGADPSAALDQLDALLGSGAVTHADLAQDSTMASDASSASSTISSTGTMTSSGPTTQAMKAAQDPSFPKSGPESTDGKPGSTPGKSTPAAMESDTKPADKAADLPSTTDSTAPDSTTTSTAPVKKGLVVEVSDPSDGSEVTVNTTGMSISSSSSSDDGMPSSSSSSSDYGTYSAQDMYTNPSGMSDPSMPKFETATQPSTFQMFAEYPGGSPVKKSEGDAAMADDILEKAAQQPLATQPPTGVTINSGASVTDKALPDFMAALESGSLRGAQAVVRKINGGAMDQIIFDEMVSKATRWLLDTGGWKQENFSKINQLGQRSLEPSDMNLKKSIAMADMPNYYLIRLVKLMLPLYAGLRRRIPANPPAVGSNQANWRAQLGYGSVDFAAALSTTEASIGGSVPNSFLNFTAPFMRIAFNNLASLESVYTARGYDDPLQVAVISTLTSLLKAEELKILFDNSGSLAAPTVTSGSTSSGGTLAAGSYIGVVTALTGRGWLKNQLSGGSGGGSAGYGVGETTGGSGAQQVTAGATSTVTLTWPAVPGAVAYNVYIGYGGSVQRYYSTVTINKATISSLPAAGGSSPTTNTSANSNGFEGVNSWCDLSTIYGNAIPNKTFTDQAGSGLTTYAGGISEFDTLLAALWNNWQTAPTMILTSANGVKHLTKQLLSTSATSAYRIEVGGERGNISGGAFVTGYTNKFAPWADGTPRVIDIMAHPYMPDGKYQFLSESVTYPMAREARGLALEVLIPYTYFPLAQTLVQYPFSMLCSETLECFNPGAFATIAGVDITA